MQPCVIRPANPTDAVAIRTIYAPIVEETAISFETKAPSVEAMAARIADTLQAGHAYVVACMGSDVAGYAYSGPHRSRAAYAPSIDVSVYVAPHARLSGVGTQLYTTLFDALASTDFHMAYAGITLPNAASVALHERMGFTHLGTFHEVGWKLGQWHDVGWWQRPVRKPR